MHEQCLPVEAIRHLSPRHFIVTFRSPRIASEAIPGQFVMMSVREAFDPLLRRPMAFYGIERGEDSRPWGFSILIEIHGRGTALLSQVEEGDPIRILGPLGRPFRAPDGTPLAAAGATEGQGAVGEEGGAVEPLMVMGGVGTAPFPFLAEALIERGLRPRAFVGARTADDLLCIEDFVDLDVPTAMATEDGTVGHHGLVTEPVAAYLDEIDGPAALYACGPTAMMRAVDRMARERGLPLQVSLEAPMACGIGVCLSCVVKKITDGGWTYVRSCREGPVFDSRSLVWE